MSELCSSAHIEQTKQLWKCRVEEGTTSNLCPWGDGSSNPL